MASSPLPSGLRRSSRDHFGRNSSSRLLTRMSVQSLGKAGSRASGGSGVRPQTDWREEAGGGRAFAFATQISRSRSPRICPAPRRFPRGPWRGRPECWQPLGRSLSPGRAADAAPMRQVHRISVLRQRTTACWVPIPKTDVRPIDRSQFGSWRIALHAQRILTRCHQLPAGAWGAAPGSPESWQGRPPRSSIPHFWTFGRQIDRRRPPHRKARLHWRGRAQCRVAGAGRFPPTIRSAAVSTVAARTRVHRLLTMARGADHRRKHAGEVPIARKCPCGCAGKNVTKTIR